MFITLHIYIYIYIYREREREKYTDIMRVAGLLEDAELLEAAGVRPEGALEVPVFVKTQFLAAFRCLITIMCYVVSAKNHTPFTQALAMPSSRKNCSPATDFVFARLIFPGAFLSEGGFVYRHPCESKS